MASKDKREHTDNKDERFNNTVSSPILDIMRQQSKNKSKELEEPDNIPGDNPSSRRFPFKRRK